MQPSSLVFLVIIAVWAAYFVQYWIRRREHLATARSVDQFSESMRVLERRGPLPVADLSTPSPRSYAVSPARPARAQVLVKRAETPAAVGGRYAAGSGAAGPVGEERAPDLSAREPSAQDRVAARRTRAMVMLGALSTVVVAVPLVALSMLPLLTLLVPIFAVGLAVAWARATAQAERHARREQRRAPRAAGHGTPARGTATQATATQTTATQGTATRGTETQETAAHGTATPVRRERSAEATGEQADPEVDPRVRREPELFDVQAQETSAKQSAADNAGAAFVASSEAAEPAAAPRLAPLVDEDDIPLTWDPVPVPRPTYAMKSRVTRPAPTAADLVGDADTEYAAYDEGEQLRRVAGA